MDFLSSTIYKNLLPTKDDWKMHPIKSFKTFWSVYKMHIEQQSADTAARRRIQLEDVEKRRAYRRAQGIDERRLPLNIGAEMPTEETRGMCLLQTRPDKPLIALSGTDREESANSYVDYQGKVRRPVRRWLGIWGE
jgi:hypothetical protein